MEGGAVDYHYLIELIMRSGDMAARVAAPRPAARVCSVVSSLTTARYG